MLYLYFGADVSKARKKARATINSLLKKQPDASYRELTDETFDRSVFEEAISGGRGLFFSRILVFIDGVCGDKETEEFIAARAEDMAASANIFIIADGALSASTKKKLSARAEKHEEFSLSVEKEKKNNLGFAVGDAFCSRDKRGAWIAFEKAIRSGLSPEEILGTLAWQIKNLLIVKIGGKQEAEKSGISGFPLSKTLRYEKNFSQEELELLSARLTSLYHGAREKNGAPLKISMEKFLLSR